MPTENDELINDLQLAANGLRVHHMGTEAISRAIALIQSDSDRRQPTPVTCGECKFKEDCELYTNYRDAGSPFEVPVQNGLDVLVEPDNFGCIFGERK